MTSIQEHQSAPTFDLADQSGSRHALKDYAGQWVLLYFYPKDDTPGCTTEACDIRDSWQEFSRRGITVLGVSADDEQSHAQFAQKFNLPFPLLADTNHSVCEAYDVWHPKKMFGKEFLGIVRTSYLIDPLGKIAKVYPNVDPKQHVVTILKDFDELNLV